jgi:two-component system OmpR family sensor kinase
VRVFSEGDEAVIEVADEGPGMEPEEAKRVFERFWRSDPARTRASGGAGLGLSIVRAIAEAHGGRATVEAVPGEGATFRIYLPRQVDEAKGEEPPTTPAPVPAIPVSELEDATD